MGIKVVTIVILTIKMLRFATLSICLIILALAYDSDAKKGGGRRTPGGKGRPPKEFYKIDNEESTCVASETATSIREKKPSDLCSTEGEQLCICGNYKNGWKAKCAECKFSWKPARKTGILLRR